MTDGRTVDCSHLGVRTDLKSYIQLMSITTGNDFDLVGLCKSEICAALWSSGNPDVDGIGMSIGYVLDVVIGTVLTLIFLVLATFSHRKQRTGLSMLLSKTFGAYYDSAIFLAFSIQLAGLVMLAKANFGSSANGMGANTMEVTWIVSLLTLLPLSHGVFIFRHQDELSIEDIPQEDAVSVEDHEKKMEKAKSKDDLRFLLFVIAWMPSAYPFFSRMICTFGESAIVGLQKTN